MNANEPKAKVFTIKQTATVIEGLTEYRIRQMCRCREYFYSKLDKHFPGMKQRYIRAFGAGYECLSPDNARLMGILHDECSRHNIL